MAVHPHAEVIPRSPATQAPGNPDLPAAAWADLEELLLAGAGTTWLSVGRERGVHVRPAFAAWTGTSFAFASNPGAVKSRHLDADGHYSLATDLGRAHLVVEGTAARLTGEAELTRAATAMREVDGWPTRVVGDRLDADGAAPSSGDPPFNAYEVTPAKAFAFPTEDQFDPTRFTFA